MRRLSSALGVFGLGSTRVGTIKARYWTSAAAETYHVDQEGNEGDAILLASELSIRSPVLYKPSATGTISIRVHADFLI